MTAYPDPADLPGMASAYKAAHKKLFKALKALKSVQLDAEMHSLHNQYMSENVCLDCANCCKTISPAMSNKDVDRIAKSLKKKPSEIIDEYIFRDAEGDLVFRDQPCPFLGKDNYCSIYEARPKACREYPHTDRRKQQQILALTQKNIAVCPVVFSIVENLKLNYL